MREYGIDLCASLRTMSWRRFQVLVSGLSPDSVLAHVLANRPIEITDPKQAMAIIDRFMR